MKKYIVFPTLLMLNACLANSADLPNPSEPQNWSEQNSASLALVDAAALKSWWTGFNDPILNTLVEKTMLSSPDRLIAESKIAEARGLRKASRSSLFPQIGASGSTGREDTGAGNSLYPDSFYEAGFDASFELDFFGRNRNNAAASGAQLDAAQEQYHAVSLTLIADVTRNYIDFRAAQNQLRIAQKNLTSQEKTLTLIEDLNRLGSAPRLDVERAVNLVNTTRASLPEFSRLADNARLRLSVLTGALPEELATILIDDAEIPGADIQPVLMTPAQVLAMRPDVKASIASLIAQTSLSKAAAAEIFPIFSLSGFYGVADNALVSTVSPWNIALGAAVSILNFGKIEGQIDAEKAREKQAYEQYRKTVLQAVSEVETALSDYTHIEEKQVSLGRAFESADKALVLSQTLYKEGEISFLDVLDAQRTANNAESALVSARAAQAESVTRIFKSLGVY
tara:strand:- start:164 stop:1525 length:1362 start_codon:yes stop_codon:yes gene_type:complete